MHSLAMTAGQVNVGSEPTEKPRGAAIRVICGRRGTAIQKIRAARFLNLEEYPMFEPRFRMHFSQIANGACTRYQMCIIKMKNRFGPSETINVF